MRKCGKESLVPVIMAMDSLAAGSDTTGVEYGIISYWSKSRPIGQSFSSGNTCAFLLYHLAANPEKQDRLHKVNILVEYIIVLRICVFV